MPFSDSTTSTGTFPTSIVSKRLPFASNTNNFFSRSSPRKTRCHDLKLLQPNLDFRVRGLRQRFVRSGSQDIIFDLRPQFLRDARCIGVNMLGSQQFAL